MFRRKIPIRRLLIGRLSHQMRLVLLFAAMLFALPTSARSAMPPRFCGSYPAIKAEINQRHSEYLRWRGITKNGAIVTEIFVDGRKGSAHGFTIIVRFARTGIACVFISGYDWQDARGDTPWRVPEGAPH